MIFIFDCVTVQTGFMPGNRVNHERMPHNIHLMYGPEGNSEFCFPESPDVSRDEVEGNIRTRGKTKLTSFPRDHTLSVYYGAFVRD